MEVLPDDRLPAKGPGRAPHGNFLLAEARVGISKASSPGEIT